MKRIYVLLTACLTALFVLTGCGASKAPAATGQTTEDAARTDAETREGETAQPSGKSEAIVVYFSLTGNTEEVATYICEELNLDHYRIEAIAPYTAEDAAYNTDCRAAREQQDPSARPEIAGELPDLTSCDTVYLGYPIWHGLAPKLLYTFLDRVDLSGKTVIPFCTSEASPVGSSVEEMKPLAPGAAWKDGVRFAPDAAREEIVQWLSQTA